MEAAGASSGAVPRPSGFARSAYAVLEVVLSDLQGAGRAVADPVSLAGLSGAGHRLSVPAEAFGDPATDAAAQEVVVHWRRGSARLVDEVRELGDLLTTAGLDYARRDHEGAQALASVADRWGIGRASR